jgi:hypothetical protein
MSSYVINKEWIKEYFNLLQAFKEEKPIQKYINEFGNNKWIDVEEQLDLLHLSLYRIKPEIKYIPFTVKNNLINKIICYKDNQDIKYSIVYQDKDRIGIIGTNTTYYYAYNYLLNNFVFTDGSPCGIFQE